MFIAAAIVSSLLAVLLIASTLGKLVKAEAVMDTMAKVASRRTRSGCSPSPNSQGPSAWWPVCSGGRSGSPPRSA